MVRRVRIAEFFRMVDRQVIKEDNLEAKTWLASHGFRWRLSMYGKLREPRPGTSHFRRIEILADREIQASDVSYLYSIFSLNPPDDEYTIWVLHDRKIAAVRKK